MRKPSASFVEAFDLREREVLAQENLRPDDLARQVGVGSLVHAPNPLLHVVSDFLGGNALPALRIADAGIAKEFGLTGLRPDLQRATIGRRATR